MPGKVILKATKGPIQGQVFAYDDVDTLVIGREDDCRIKLPDQSKDDTASRHHCILQVNPPDVRIRDLGSRNGTHINGKKYGGRAKDETPEEGAKWKYPEVDLKDGDEVRVGKTVFTVQVEVPAYCCDCGRLITDAEKKACEWIADSFICPQCRAKAERAAKPKEAPKKPEPMRCAQCGKDVEAEVGRGRRGDYVCEACQSKAESDPVAVLLKMILGKAREQGEEAPKDIAGYEIGKQLGRGGMGAVYLARRKKDGTKAALKVMLADVAVNEDSRERFLREIESHSRLRHRNVVELLDQGSAGSGFYFVMEFCPGGSLDGLMERRGGRLSLAEAGPIMLQALEGLAWCHEHGYVHRDLKPPNILLTATERGIAKVSDFGLAKNFEDYGLSRGLTRTGAYAGTYPFMPHEQVTNFKRVKPVTDVWSMGATFYYLLTGKVPREVQKGQDPIEAILHNEAVPIRKRESSISKKVAEVLDQALAKGIHDRFATAAEFRAALEAVL